MTDTQTNVVKATAEAQAAREKLQRDVHALQERLDPKTITRQAKGRLTDTGVSAANSVKRNPKPVAGVAVLLAVFLVRKPLGRLFRRRPNKTYSDGTTVAVTSNR